MNVANVSAAATVWNAPNYVGELFLVGANQTPFLNMIGGLTGGVQVNSWEFPVAQTFALETAAQPAITETASLTAPSPKTYVRSQDKNVAQIFQYKVSVSYAKQSNAGTLSGLALAGQDQPVQNEFDFQMQQHLRQTAVDVDYTFLNGAYNLASNAGEANKTRGIIAAATTNTVDASSAAFASSQLNELLRTMASNGAQFGNMVAFCNAFQKQALTAEYAYAPQDRNVAGVNITQIETDFCMLGVVWAPHMPTDTILVADVSVCAPVFLPVPGKGYLFSEMLSKAGASEDWQIYGQIGLAYGPEEFHGTITSLATS
jgi:hypothetical protein